MISCGTEIYSELADGTEEGIEDMLHPCSLPHCCHVSITSAATASLPCGSSPYPELSPSQGRSSLNLCRLQALLMPMKCSEPIFPEQVSSYSRASTPCFLMLAGEPLLGSVWTWGLNPSLPSWRGCSCSQACSELQQKSLSAFHATIKAKLRFIFQSLGGDGWAGDPAFRNVGSAGWQPGWAANLWF